jgi:alpha-mannosidase
VGIGGYQDHLPHLDALTHTVSGELRSPAFAPVLAGVASARMREKQAAHRATVLLSRYAEPLAAWAALGGTGGGLPSLIGRAWRQLFLNHAHDSAAGCGVDLTHEDVKARYRWAEQLARAAIDRAIAQLRVGSPGDGVAFHPGPAATGAVFVVHVPRALEGELCGVGSDGIARPVQSLGALDGVEDRPVFEGEFSAAELSQYLGGLDPKTPIFGKYLQGITAHAQGGGLVRLDVGLGDAPVDARRLEEDQRKISALLAEAVRFKVVLHGGGVTRPLLVAAAPAPAGGLVTVSVRRGAPATGEPRAARLPGDRPGITAGPISVVAEPSGTVLITDSRLAMLPVRVNDLVDEGDRGDLYHFEGVQPAVRPRHAKAEVIEAGPLRAQLAITSTLPLPVGLTVDRRGRADTIEETVVRTVVTLTAYSTRVELETSFQNRAFDHRLRALCHVPITHARLDVEHGLCVVERPTDPAAALGAGSERAALTGQHHGFCDVTDGVHGVALFSRGLPEHEAFAEAGGTRLALTLLRSVGWLSRGDLSVIDHAAGPMVPTPSAQELGDHELQYAVFLHAGNWRKADLVAESRRYAAPPMPITPGPHGRTPIPSGRPLVDVAPAQVIPTAMYPAAGGDRSLFVRVVNASPDPAEATLRPAFPLKGAEEVDPLEHAIPRARAQVSGGCLRLPLGAWEIATVRLW